MKKLILIPTNDEIGVGDVVKCNHLYKNELNYFIGIVKNIHSTQYGTSITYTNGNSDMLHNVTKQLIYIIDTEATINEGDYIHTITNEIFKIIGGFRTALDFKLIATNNPSINIPQLTQQAIKTIAEKNGDVGEFDIKIYRNLNGPNNYYEVAEIIFPIINSSSNPIKEITKDITLKEIEDLYDNIIDSLSNFKTLEENKIKNYNSKVKKLNEELKYVNDFDKLETLDWFNETVKLNEIRNNVIELYRLLNRTNKVINKQISLDIDKQVLSMNLCQDPYYVAIEAFELGMKYQSNSSTEEVLNIIDFIINNAQIEDRDLFINNQLLNSEQVLTEYKKYHENNNILK